ncbi:MAG: hypothetical protein M3142_08915 [Bacteroidota bacterium]|nr:hypothetical protein [Bacteroidota bacterium]
MPKIILLFPAPRLGLTISSYISVKIDFTVGSNGNLSLTQNSAAPDQNTNYVIINNRARLNWIFGKGLVLQTDFNQRIYSGFSTNLNQSYSLWNLSIG